MKHFLQKNINVIQGGGGKKGGGGGSPPPAELQPPKLGKLQTLASYSYSEIIDLISDGPIEGLVNKNGQYIQGNRIFEGIYFDNTPVKKSFDISYTGSNPVSASGYLLTGTTTAIYNKWFSSGEFYDVPFTGIGAQVTTGTLSGNLISGLDSYQLKTNSYFANNATVNDPYLSIDYSPISHVGNAGNAFECPDSYIRDKYCEITWNREDIAKSIYKGIDLLKTISTNSSVYGEDASDIAAQKLLRYNYLSWADVKDKLLPYPVNSNEADYPLFAVKFELGSPYSEIVTSECGNTLSSIDIDNKEITVSSDFSLSKYANTLLYNDIANQVSQKVEIEDIQSTKIVRPIQYLDLTYLRKTSSTKIEIGGSIIVFGFKNGRSSPSEESIKAIYDFIRAVYIVRPDNEKYNYNNVLCENRNGDEFQTPLGYFNKVYIDKEYGIKLPGPFDVSNQIFRVSNFDDDTGFNLRGTYEFPLSATISNEGSSDTRNSKDFSSYAGNSRSQFVESAVPITHIIENPNVEQVFISMGVRSLSDTNQIDTTLPGVGSVQAGTRIPSAVRFKVEIGSLDSFGKEVSSSIEERIYQIVGLADSAAIVDIGREETSSILNNYKFLQGTRGNNSINASTAIILPEATTNNRRFVRITRTTFETSSSLVRREISLEKITEIINTKFAYPGSAIIGVKIDSRNLSAIPPRSYDLRLKRIMVPSNYFPLRADGSDKRRYKTSTDFEAATSQDLQIYNGNWDGTFKQAWTDNPAWVLFDMLTNMEYGLGAFIEPSQINIWELYKIGRFCDAVDKNGVFQGVANTFGGKEPRYSINVIMADKINVFDAINSISSVFRGNVFYANSFIDFSDDRIKIPIAEFSNANVKEGTFSYTNSRLDEEFNVVEVSYLDESDEFKPKIEYVENSDDIRKRGILRNTIDSFGVTSKAMARRIGKHVLYATTNENQAVSFIGGNEALFVKPGDLISVNDELKTLQRNFGRVLDVFPEERKVWINEKFQTGYYLGEVTLFAPTGKRTFEDLLSQARTSGGIGFKDIYESDVPQVQTFKVSGSNNSPEYGSYLYLSPETTYPMIRYTGAPIGTGLYSGSGYLNGFDRYVGIESSTNGYQILKGTGSRSYNNPSVSATSPDLFQVEFLSVENGYLNFSFNGSSYTFEYADANPGGGYWINTSSMTSENQMASATAVVLNTLPLISASAAGNRVIIANSQTGSSANSFVSAGMVNVYTFGGGYGNDEIAASSGVSVVFDDYWSLKTGVSAIFSGCSGLSQPYLGVWTTGGCVYSPNRDNANLEFLNRVKNGSPFGITMSGIEREIYKVTSIKESNVNEYEIAAIKFNTGKFAEIEASQNLDDFYSEFSFIPSQQRISPISTDALTYGLETPQIALFQTGNYDGQNDSLDITGSWTSVLGATSYFVTLIDPDGSKISVSLDGTGYAFNDQSKIGYYRLTVAAKNSSVGYTSRTTTSGINVYASETFITPYIKSITLA